MDTDWVWVLVPMTALSIPLAAVVGRVIVRPIALAVAKLGETDHSSAIVAARTEQRFMELDARLARMEQLLTRALVEQEQRRQIQAGQDTLQQPPRLESGVPTPFSSR